MALVKHGLLVVVWLGTVGFTVREVRAVRGIYVNNHKIEKFETTPAPGSGNNVSKHGLLTKVNFTSPQQYYQYLVGEDPVHYIDLLWGKNKTQLPSIFRIGSGPVATTPTTISYADEASPIKNTLNNTSMDYIGDYQRPEELQSTSATLTPPVSTTKASPIKPSRKRKKKPVASQSVQLLGAPENASGFNKTELTPETLSLLSRYYSFSCTLTPLRTPAPAIPTQSTVSTTRRTKTRYLTTSFPTPRVTTKRPKPSPPTPSKQKKPVVYVDPPVIKRISGVLESVYKFMENALTSTEYVDESEEIRTVKQSAMMPNATLKPPKASKVKRNTYTNHVLDSASGENAGDVSRSMVSGTEETWLPVSSNDAAAKVTKHFTPKLVTISGLPSTLSSDGNKNKMTTNIQVTSEYTAATPPTVSLSKPSTDSSGEESSEEESDEDYFDGFGGFEGEDEDDDEDEEDDDEEDTGDSNESVRPNRQTALSNDKDYDEVAAHVELPVRIKRVKKRRKQKRPAASYEDTAEYSDEDDSDEGEDEYDQRDESIEEDDDEDEDDEPAPEGFFNRMFYSFGRIFRSLGFGGAARGTPDDYGGRSTTPRVLATEWGRRPTRSTSGQSMEVRPLVERSPASWFYLTNELEEEDAQEELVLPTLEPQPITTEPSWFELMMPWDFFNTWSLSAGVEQEDVTEASTTEVSPSEVPVSSSSPTSTPLVSGWFAQLFGAKTTTKLPPTVAPTAGVPKPEQLLSVLAQYVAQSVTTQRPTGPSHATAAQPQPTSYAGYQLWRIRVHSEEHLQRLEDYRQSPEGLRLQWWTSPGLMRSTDVLVPPGAPGDALREFLQDEGLRYEPTIRDLGRAISYENPRLTRREQAELELLHGHPLTWYRYHRYGDMVKYMHYLQRRHPHRVQLLHIGRSYEGRPVTVVRVSFANSNARPVGHSRKPAKKRPAVFVEAGAHGHQWIGPAVATWLLNRLTNASALEEITNSTQVPKTFQAYDWYVLPVLNPDGYEYSHRHDRMWSKSRAKVSPPPAAGVGQAFLESAIHWWQTGNHTRGSGDCLGVDLNRNWAYRWQQAASPDRRTPCSDTYAGAEPFSEPEVRALRDFLLTRRRNVRLYLSLQAYGQQLSYPELEVEETGDGHLPGTYSDIHDMASGGLEAMRAEAGEFLYGLEPVGGTESYGTAAGYARHGAGIRYSYTLHLPDTGTHGFLLPPSNIVPIGKDVFELLKGVHNFSNSADTTFGARVSYVHSICDRIGYRQCGDEVKPREGREASGRPTTADAYHISTLRTSATPQHQVIPDGKRVEDDPGGNPAASQCFSHQLSFVVD
uniref:Peptidase M14 domain-containing protein n=1 Tax=Anopheles farauti TaxID=69004 RepID=A0A182QK99_9DIPT